MTPAERKAIKREICEYLSIIEWASQCDRLETLKRAHLTPIERDAALNLLLKFSPEVSLEVRYRGRRGRARCLAASDYRIALPAGEPGGGFGRLRVGIVLHELAHVMDHLCRYLVSTPSTAPQTIRMNHAIGFKKRFGELLDRWEKERSQS